ncbi:MAG: YhcH/YjgK/YiaL family protein [Prevotellaceae bacterium]|mgnify:FL=1|nr:YhcH/YjgK/YiaL family protein [Prevotellaceae bacterium]MDD6842832.1 YhcH/YjgK/YiaL family protein [Prevotellaceae bacterium]
MIIDKIVNLRCYEDVNPLFKDVADFIEANDLNALPAGKHEIKGADLFVNVTTAKGKAPEEAVMETHKRMIDIQIPLDTDETFGYTPTDNLPDVEYNDAKDVSKYPDLMADSYVTCQPGMFAIFFPQDGHAPCISAAPEIKKVIFKVKCK